MLEFDRRYVLLPVLLGVALVIASFLVAEFGQQKRIASVNAIQLSQERNRILAELQLVVTDAESAQRGFILTGNDSYLIPYREAKAQVERLTDELNRAYDGENDPGATSKSSDLNALITTKFAEIDATLALYEKGRSQAMALMRTDFGQRAMGGVRDLAREMRAQERELVFAQTEEWLRANRFSRISAAGAAALNIILILVAGVFVTRDLQRRTSVAMELESQVAKSTAELSELSTYLQRISEQEKSALARELHDELGGLLIGIKMDLSQLKSQLDLANGDIKTRWDRIQSTLSAGIDLKRRVIEQLRPSLLDNMGLIAALKWQASVICSGANLALVERYPDAEPQITPDAAIAIFRIAQEALTNIVKHARATAVALTLVVENDRLTLCIEDNGVGITPDRQKVTGSHGVAGMRHRLKSYSGEFKLERNWPNGTRLVASVPFARVTNATPHAA
jgi:signal transduction histidine kinase